MFDGHGPDGDGEAPERVRRRVRRHGKLADRGEQHSFLFREVRDQVTLEISNQRLHRKEFVVPDAAYATDLRRRNRQSGERVA